MSSPEGQASLLSDPLLREIPVNEGYKVLDRCVLYSKLGQGGMGAVYRARHMNLDIDVAVKCLSPNVGDGNPDFVTRFQREARVAAGINNENLVRVFDVAEESGLHYLIMEYVAGENARERVQRKGPLEVHEALTVAMAAAKGLAAAHQHGVVHRDVKPDNIMISQAGEVKLADLGLARAADTADSLQTATGMVMGTPRYMPPEQFESAQSVGPPGDVWAMGAVLYFLLTGRDGIDATSLPEVMRQVVITGFPSLSDAGLPIPEDLCEVVRRCTLPDPKDRFADAGELLNALEACEDLDSQVTILADAGAGSQRATALVSPPPAHTVARIRDGGEMEAETLVREAPRPASETAQESERASPSASKGLRVLGAVLAGIVLLGGSIWFARALGIIPSGGGGGPDPAEVGEKDQNSRKDSPPRSRDERLAEAKRLTGAPDTLDAALEELRSLAIDYPNDQEVKALFLTSLRSSLLAHKENKDYEAALRACREAQSLESDPAMSTMEESLISAYQADMQQALVIDVPASDDIVRQGPVSIEGRLAFPGRFTLELEGERVEVAGGRFLVPWQAEGRGRQDIPFEIVSESGVRSKVSHGVRVDAEAPVIRITTPPEDFVSNQEEVKVKGVVGDDIGVAHVDVNGDRVGTSTRGEFYRAVPCATAGPTRIVIVVRDKVGRETRIEREVRVDREAPELKVDAPDLVPAGEDRKISIEVRDASRVVVKVNGREAQSLGEGKFEGKLLATDSDLIVVATDEAGNSRQFEKSYGRSISTWAHVAPGTPLDEKTQLPRRVTDKASGIEMVLIPAGSYRRGSAQSDRQAEADEGPNHRVMITRPFYLGKYEVTNRQFRLFRPDHDSDEAEGQDLNADDQPAVLLSWDDALAFCRRFGFRLPTEAEWEHAARVQRSYPYPWGSTVEEGEGFANLCGRKTREKHKLEFFVRFDDGFETTSPVGSFKPNDFGLHDIIGNVWEWCSDRYGADEYARHFSGVSNPAGALRGTNRVIRGGGWKSAGPLGRVSDRHGYPAEARHSDLGFRVARHP